MVFLFYSSSSSSHIKIEEQEERTIVDRPGGVRGANTIREEAGEKKVSRKKGSQQCKRGVE